MAAAIKGVFRDEQREAVLRSKVLVVGAGGIGCEILKNLVLSGFPDIEIVSILCTRKVRAKNQANLNVTATRVAQLVWIILVEIRGI